MKCILISLFFILLSAPKICQSSPDLPASSAVCMQLLEDLSRGVQSFINCSMNHAIPVTFCLNCDAQYADLVQAYTNLNTKSDEKNVSCQTMFFNRDRLGLVQKSYSAGVDLWAGAYCDDCYETPTSVVSNSTTEFLDLVHEFEECTRIATQDDVCTACLDVYTRVNSKYEAIKRLANDLVCFDLQDKVNQTRRCWSIDVRCNTNPDEKQITFLILTASITSLPIIFYILMFAHQHMLESQAENTNLLNESTTEPEEEEELEQEADQDDQLRRGGPSD